jgi:hypothetical protein
MIGILEARQGDLSLLPCASDRSRHPSTTACDRIARHFDIDPPDAATDWEDCTAPPSARRIGLLPAVSAGSAEGLPLVLTRAA